MNQRKCRMFSVLNEEQPASWPHLPLRPLLAVRLAWDVSIKIAERNCLETLPYINRSVLKKRAACIGTVQNEGDWAQPNKHFAKQKWHLYRQKPCLPNRFSGQEPRCSIKKGFYWKTIRKRRLASNWFDFCRILVCCLYKVCYARTASVQCWIVLCSRTHAGNHSP